MSDPRIDAFFARHRASSTEVREALAARDAGGVARVGTRDVPARELLDIYRARAAHLSSKPTEHARQLAARISSLCDAIAADPDRGIMLVGVTAVDGRTFNFFEQVDSLELVGSLLSYDARQISDEDYLRIWGRSRPMTPDGAA